MAILLLIGAIAGRGTTSANRLGVGDCFASPGNGDFTEVTDQDCAGPHDLQIYASVTTSPFDLKDFDFDDIDLENFDPDNPPQVEFETRSATERCDEELTKVLLADHMSDPTIVIPEDTLLAQFSDNTSNVQTKVLCALESPSGGLVGSIIP